MTYRWRPTPLHATRATVGSAYCVVLTGVALSFEHPLILGWLLATVLVVARCARVTRDVARMVAWAVPFAVVIALVNALIVREGLTVIARGGDVPWLGSLDVTLEATAYGAILGLRAIVVLACFALHSAAVDPDDLLRAFRRVGFRSALTAALATRMVPVLARDARRMHDAQRCRPGAAGSKWAVVRAVTSGSLDRAVDVAATLEVRGYGAARRPPRTPRPWSRHDLAFALSAVALLALAVGAVAGGWEPFEAYPRLDAPVTGGVVALCALLSLAALAPFLQRRGIGSC